MLPGLAAARASMTREDRVNVRMIVSLFGECRAARQAHSHRVTGEHASKSSTTACIVSVKAPAFLKTARVQRK